MRSDLDRSANRSTRRCISAALSSTEKGGVCSHTRTISRPSITTGAPPFFDGPGAAIPAMAAAKKNAKLRIMLLKQYVPDQAAASVHEGGALQGHVSRRL